MRSPTTADSFQSTLLPSAEAQETAQPPRLSSTTVAAAHSEDAKPAKGQALTFGLELEFNIAFTEQTLVSILDSHNINYSYIQKEHPDSGHSSLLMAEDYSKYCRSKYPSWGIAMPLDAKDLYTNAVLTSPAYGTVCKQTGQCQRVRSYVSEPPLLAHDLMQQRNLQVDVRAIIRNLGIDQSDILLPGSTGSGDYLLCRSADYSKWTLTNDHTLVGSLKPQLMQHLPSKVTASNVNDWDSHGIELISPVFRLDQKDQPIADLSSRLATLSSPSVDMVPSIWASLHVHIGFNAPQPCDPNFKTLQHLAYILLVHEDLITSLFPTHCSGLERIRSELVEPENPDDEMSYEDLQKIYAREEAAPDSASKDSESSAESGFTDASTAPTSASMDTQQNNSQKYAENEAQVLEAERTFTNHQNKLSNARFLASLLDVPYPAPSAAIAEAIFCTQSIPELVHLLQKPKDDKKPAGDVYRGYMYNFSNVLDFSPHGTGKPTVEFRQHECCIDAEKVGKWVRFVEGVVKKAEEMAAEHESHNNVFHIQEVEDFCRWISIDADDTRYWMERHGKFRKEQKI